MATPLDDPAQRDAFLAEPRLAILMSSRKSGTPLGVPVWFEWSDGEVRMFALGTSLKVKRLRRDPRASVLVTNRVGEPEGWVAFDGEMTVGDHEGAIELAERMAERYWDLDDPERQQTLELWRAAAQALCTLTLVPDRIRTGQ
ncbi:MAG: pyridoxamine 5'-phosphate oxidase family protein [Myxococcota bacterium]|nr:pyridoxamine 5'-phosphate oxidase family protein [Myxococcota bacterium]